MTTHEWLPMPSGISATSHDSFTRDLLYQFDKRRIQLIDGEDIATESSIQNSKISDVSAIVSTRPRSLSTQSHSNSISTEATAKGEPTSNTQHPNNHNHESSILIENIDEQEIIQGTTVRRRSAGDLLRKSSLYLKAKFNEGFQSRDQHTIKAADQPRALPFDSWTLKKKPKRHNIRDIFKDEPNITPPSPQHLSKIAVNTTINIQPQTSHSTRSGRNLIQPPIITQYPPKPLKYSPVEPLLDKDIQATSHSKKLQRLSLPLLRLAAQQQQQQQEQEQQESSNPTLQRRRSDSDLLNRSIVERSSHTTNVLHSISRTWHKLLYNCKRGVKKKKNQ